MRFGWTYPIAVAQFGPNGETEIAVVRTPHIDPIVEFRKMTVMGLEVIATVPAFASHVLGSRNLDMAIAVDFDSNGQHELIIPSPNRTVLYEVRSAPLKSSAIKNISATEGKLAQISYSSAVDGQIVTNIATARTDDDSITIAVGTAERQLRIWEPK